jgi:hypothetical protein
MRLSARRGIRSEPAASCQPHALSVYSSKGETNAHLGVPMPGVWGEIRTYCPVQRGPCLLQTVRQRARGPAPFRLCGGAGPAPQPPNSVPVAPAAPPAAACVKNDPRTPTCVTIPTRLEYLSCPDRPCRLWVPRLPENQGPDRFLYLQNCSDVNARVHQPSPGPMFMTCITFLHLTLRGCQCQTPSLADAFSAG